MSTVREDFIKPVSTWDSGSYGYDEDIGEDRDPYYHPALPTPAEDPTPPPPLFQKEEEPTPFQSFLASPLEYIFGANDEEDDDVSTLDGGSFREGEKQWEDRDDSFVNKASAERSFTVGTQPTINEEGYESDEVSFREDFQQSYTDENQRQNQDGYAHTSSMYPSSEYRQAMERSEANEKALCHTNAFDNFDREVKRSYHSGRGPVQFSVNDEAAARARLTNDDVSISLSAAFSRHIEPLLAAPLSGSFQDNNVSNTTYSESIHQSQSEISRPSGVRANSWRSIKSGRPGMSSTGSSDAAPSPAQSFRTTTSRMPETPDIIPSSTAGGPMMTRGMSGRAVVHVSMDNAADGCIERLDYTIPVIDVHINRESEYFDDEDTIVAGNKIMNPWNDDNFARSKLGRKCLSKKCMKISVLLLLAASMFFTATVSLTAVITLQPASPSLVSSSAAFVDSSAPNPIPGVKLPADIDTHMKNWLNSNGIAPAGKDDVPFFFHIPLSGALIASMCWTHCLSLTVASDGGKKAVSNRTLEVINSAGSKFVNVDLSSVEGIRHAAEMSLIPSSLPDVVFSPHFREVVNKLFKKVNPTTLVMTIRHPVSRAVAMFDYLKRTNPNPDLAEMTLEQYALSGFIQNNYVVRLLTGKHTGAISADDVSFCKELLRRKAVIGLYEDMEGSINLFQRYFGWSPTGDDPIGCERKYIQEGLSRESAKELDVSSSAYVLIQRQNVHDMALYDYIRNKLVPFQMQVISRESQDPGIMWR